MIDSTQVFCVLQGHDYVYELQSITQIFFANARFAFVNDISMVGYTVVGRLEHKLDAAAPEIICIGEFYCNGQLSSSHILSTSEVEVKSAKRTLMLALFHALKEATGQPTPWGALVGVRPAKQARLWLEEGDSEAAVTKRLNQVYQCREDKIRLALEVARAEQKLIARQKLNSGVGLYIGIPFCPSRCLYCSFVVAQKAGADAHKRYLTALTKECKKLAADLHLNRQSINAIYIGGGTPTALSEDNLAFLLEMISRVFGSFMNAAEYTVEAGRPDSITLEKLALLKENGVNRIAINPQTLNNDTLKRIGRNHTAQDFYKAYEMALQMGFTNINTDIIAGLPGEGPEDMRYTMEGLQKIAPSHITVHTLAIKRASRLNENRLEYPAMDFETMDHTLAISQEICQGLGLRPYYMYRQKNMLGHFENVGYSLPGFESLYNVAMMAETQTVLAAGAGGVTKTIFDNKQEGVRIERTFNPKDVETYIKRMEID